MKKVVTLGEIMLRLKSPGHNRLFQVPAFEATFGGGEANVAVSLANFGLATSFVSALPANEIGDAAIAELRSFGVDTTHIIRSGHRVGIYFLESGANQRPSNVVYDRAYSSIATTQGSDFDWEEIFAGASWFHITGITPALSESAADLSFAAVRAAKARGVTVSCDFNFRAKLWNYGRQAPEVMTELVKSVDVGIANEEDCQKALGIGVDMKVTGGDLELTRYESLSQLVMDRYPDMSTMAITLRESVSSDRNGWSACMRDSTGFHVAKQYEISDIVDRVGGGDSFASALIYGLSEFDNGPAALEFATAASCLKHAINGDFNRVSVPEVQKLAAGDGSGRVQR